MTKNSRTKNTIYNTGSNLLVMILKYGLNFISRTFFIKYLGETYLGLNELLVNILYMLSIAELGVSYAVGYSLYEPIAKNDYESISRIMSLFKKIYMFIGIFITFMGVVVYFFLPFFINEYDTINNITIIYFLYLINTASTYFISYKDILITSDQKNYKLTNINSIFLLISFAFELIAIIYFKSFILYLIIKFLILIIQRIYINRYISLQYKNINFNTNEKNEKEVINKIKTDVKGLVFHKVGDYAVNGTDNLIISYFLDIITVGIYSNYILITKFLQNLVATFFNSIIPSYGNLIVNENNDKILEIFKKIDFLGFTLYSFFSIIFFNCANPFISLWLGDKFVLSKITVFLLSFSFFLTGIRMASYSVKSAAGIFKEDSWSPFIQAIINLLVSIILCKYLGINGIIIGTIISSFIPILTRIYFIYRILFKKKMSSYIIHNLLIYVIFYLIVAIITSLFSKYLYTNVISLVINFMISTAIYMIVYIIAFYRNDEFKFIMDTIKKLKQKMVR